MVRKKFREDYRKAIDVLLEQKSTNSALGQLGLVSVFSFAGFLLKHEVTDFWFFAATVFGVNLVRVARHHFRRKAPLSKFWFYDTRVLRTFIGFNGLAWGAFLGHTLLNAGPKSDLGVLALILLAGVCTSAMASLAPARNLARSFVALTILPPAIVLAIEAGTISLVTCFMLAAYFAFLYVQIGIHAAGVERFFESEQHFKALANATSESIAVTEEGKITQVNHAFTKMFGYTEEEVIGMPLIKLIVSEDHQRAVDAMTNDSRVPNEFRCIRKGGAEFYVESYGRTIMHEGRVARLSCARDLTEQKRFEGNLRESERSARESARLKTEFLANMSHEIRTPLNAIIGVGDLLSELPASDQQKKYHRILTESGNGLLQLINDILDFSKIEAGHIELEKIDFSLSALLENHVELLTQRADQKGLQISASIDPNLPAMVGGDPGRIGQVLLNLMGNAIKFTSSGNIEVRALLGRQSEDRDMVRVRFEVSDTGLGMSQSTCERLFKPFMQADSSMARKFGGTGLGLSICKQLVDLMKGQISVQSKEGEGSTFSFEITLLRRSTGTVGALAEHATQESLRAEISLTSDTPAVSAEDLIGDTPKQENKVRILVAEDNSTNQILVGAMLAKLGYAYQVVADGAEAVKAFETGQFHLVLMDCQMPEVDGFQATRLIRARERKLQTRIPIVALTANATTEDQKRCYDSGMDGFLTKPVRKKQLADVLSSMTGKPLAVPTSA